MISNLIKFFITLFATATLVCGLIGGFNLAVDPFEIFSTPKLSGWNKHKSAVDEHVRLWKAHRVIHGGFRTILLGNSRVEFALSPEHVTLPKPGFNLALPSANINELAYYFEHAVATNSVAVAVLGLDLQLFDPFEPVQADYRADRMCDLKNGCAIPWRDWRDALFSWKAAEASLFTLQFQSLDDPIEFFYTNGQRYHGNRHRQPAFRDQCTLFQTIESGYRSGRWDSFDLRSGDQSAIMFTRILRIAHEHDIDLKIYFSPIHGRLLNAIFEANGWDQYSTLLRMIVKLNDDTAKSMGRPPFDLFDYTGFDVRQVAAVPSSGPLMIDYWESSHFSQNYGDWLLSDMFNGDSTHRLSAAEIEVHLQEKERAHQQWVTNREDPDSQMYDPCPL